MTPDATLRLIRDRLSGTDPLKLIEEMQPRSREDAVVWVRRLTCWEEYPYPDRVIALARVISRRAMKEYGISITEDGRVTDGRAAVSSRAFPLSISGEEVRVEYTKGYFPGVDHFQFKSPHEPVRPIPVSGSGWWSQFAHGDVVEACGGPEAYAGMVAAAQVEGRRDEFVAAFEGVRKPTKRVIGRHTAGVAEKVETPEKGSLF